jgi:formylglycine-generating enzyme required for sulfatase activity
MNTPFSRNRSAAPSLRPPRHPLGTGGPPDWASGWGHDHYGPFADLAIGKVKQRFRWCPPGEFWMGSPEGEVGRDSDEGPRHRVKLSWGFWMADTPVTQALYLAVMGTNPSQFKDPKHPDRPVESVSWEDAMRFCAKVEALLTPEGDAAEGAVFRLPTEAEWEYACRAGTETGTYSGDLTLRGENDAPELGDIAWYGGNSGVAYSLAGGVNSSGWKDKQFQDTRAGTRQVKQKRANPWGLYDTLGNVWEWCRDAVTFGERYPVSEVEAASGTVREDPVGLAGPLRAARGGSWGSDARDVRAAVRGAGTPGGRLQDLGFRLSRGPALPEPVS